MITYPVSTPTSIGIANVELTATNAVAVSRSPFTFSQQVHTYPGQMWSATVSIPPVRKDLAEPWVAFLLSLRGQTGTFLLGDPNNTTPRGTAKDYLVAVTGGLLLEDGDALLLEDGDAMLFEEGAVTYLEVDGGGQTGGTINLKGAPDNVSGYLLAGDYVQFGAAASATLHKVLVDADTDSAGDLTIEIWPGLRAAPSDSATVQFLNTVGRFRLSTNQQSWSINDSSAYGLSFDCMEAI